MIKKLLNKKAGTIIVPAFLFNIVYYAFISLFLYKFILITVDINIIKTFIITVIIGIPNVLIKFIIESIVLEFWLIPDIIDTGTVDTTITIMLINTLPLFIPNFKTKGIITDIDSIADVILVGSNKFNEISCDEVIFIDIKYTIHKSIEDNNMLTIPNKYLDKT